MEINENLKQRIINDLAEAEALHKKRYETYKLLTDNEKSAILENDCMFCGTQRCQGIFSEYGNGCSSVDKYIKEI
jgi:hypothetical protein